MKVYVLDTVQIDFSVHAVLKFLNFFMNIAVVTFVCCVYFMQFENEEIKTKFRNLKEERA